ncbi:MAG: ferrous iron transport protein A [Firmicutes bacterium]|nr:ferrous iron transport protein A [Bacillota bacterium]
MTLDNLPVGRSACIRAVGGEGALHDRLLEMGLIPGTVVQVSKLAPLGDPIEIFIQGYSLTVRREEAAMISVREQEESDDPGSGR